jgi:hypothetical protein
MCSVCTSVLPPNSPLTLRLACTPIGKRPDVQWATASKAGVCTDRWGGHWGCMHTWCECSFTKAPLTRRLVATHKVRVAPWVVLPPGAPPFLNVTRCETHTQGFLHAKAVQKPAPTAHHMPTQPINAAEPTQCACRSPPRVPLQNPEKCNPCHGTCLHSLFNLPNAHTHSQLKDAHVSTPPFWSSGNRDGDVGNQVEMGDAWCS